MKVELNREFTFEAAHHNRSAPPNAINGRLHGHSYSVVTQISGSVDDRLGWLTDYAEIKANCRPVIALLDHRLLNDIEGLTDTSCGDIQRWLAARLEKAQDGFDGCTVNIRGDTSFAPAIREEGESSARLGFGFAAAHYLPSLPEEHKCRRMHGHSFQIEVVSPNPEPLTRALETIYPRLDHRLLNDVEGLENPTSEILARWLWNGLTDADCVIDEITVNETCTTSCKYRGEE